MNGLLCRLIAIGLLTASLIVSMGCATLSNRTKTLIVMGGAALAAGAVGAALAPDGENRGAHAMLWAGSAAAVTGAIGLFAFDEEARGRSESERATRLQKDLASCADETSPDLVATNRVGLEKPLPSKFRNLITPGQWSLYKVDRWVTATDSELVHQDLIFRFSQPQLNPSAKTKVPNEERQKAND